MDEKLQNYLDGLIPERDELLLDMEKYAKENGVPIMELSAVEAMLQILRIHQPKTILEIGTAIGYSALRMAYALPETLIVTVERDGVRYREAKEFIKRSEKGQRIQLINKDAIEAENEIKKFTPFDYIFIDAAKGQYRKFFELYSPHLKNNGIILTDNVLFKGLVVEKHEHITSRNIRSLVRKINDFNNWLMANPNFDTVILPVGDGIAISRKR